MKGRSFNTLLLRFESYKWRTGRNNEERNQTSATRAKVAKGGINRGAQPQCDFDMTTTFSTLGGREQYASRSEPCQLLLICAHDTGVCASLYGTLFGARARPYSLSGASHAVDNYNVSNITTVTSLSTAANSNKVNKVFVL